MGEAKVHPRQQRLSCEGCRTHKSRCQRVYPNDPKCARCMLLKIDCTTGQQRNVGRPRRANILYGDASPGDKQADTAKEEGVRRRPPKQTELSSASLQSLSQQDWNSVLVSISCPTPLPGTRTIETPINEAPYHASVMDSTLLSEYSFPSGADSSRDLSQVSSTSSTDLGFDLDAPYSFSLGTPRTTSWPATSTSSSPPNLSTPAASWADLGSSNGIATWDALAKLSQINLDLHVRTAVAETHKHVMTFDMIVYQHGPLFINNTTLAESMLTASQDFLSILTRLLANGTRGALPITPPMSVAPDLSTIPRHPHVPSEPLMAPLALAITSIFTQLLNLFEMTVKYLFIRVELIETKPIAPLPGLTFAGLTMAYPCTQGTLFSEFVIQSLERIERALGISAHPESSEGLLSPRQIGALWSELDGECGIGSGYGIMRPASVRNSFQSARLMLNQLSLSYAQY